MRIYIESTIPSYIVARPARDLLQAARQQITKDWWDLKRGDHELFTSQIALDEIAAGEREMARLRLELVAGLKVLDSTAAAGALGDAILQSGLLPPDRGHRRGAHCSGDVSQNGYIADVELPPHSECNDRSSAASAGSSSRL